MRGKWFILTASVVLVALVAAGAMILMRARALKQQAEKKPVVAKPLVPTGDINLVGKIRPQQVHGVVAPVEGIVGAFFAEVGQEVFEGQLLARITNGGLEVDQQNAQRDLENSQRRAAEIESQIITARLEASRARADAVRSRGEYDRLNKVYQRQQMLFNEGATPKLVYEKASREFDAAKAEVESLNQIAESADIRVNEITRSLDSEKRALAEKTSNLDDAKVRTGGAEIVAPVPGLVVERNGEIGQPSPADKDLFQIATQLSLLEVVLDPDPPTFVRISPGQPALVILPDQGGEGLPGVVKAIQGNQAVVAFTSPSPNIKPGMAAQVRIRPN